MKWLMKHHDRVIPWMILAILLALALICAIKGE